jgi:hypothetical protein
VGRRFTCSQERTDRRAETEDATGRELVGELLRVEPAAVLEEVLERPVRKLRVVGRQADPLAASAAVREVVPDLAVVLTPIRRQLRLARVAEGITDREADQHPGHPIPLGSLELGRRKIPRVRRHADAATPDQVFDLVHDRSPRSGDAATSSGYAAHRRMVASTWCIGQRAAIWSSGPLSEQHQSSQ